MEDLKISLKTGDLVTFYSEQEEEDGYLSKFHDSSILEHTKSKESVFKIYPFTQYTARKAFKKKNKRKIQGELVTQQSIVGQASDSIIPTITTTSADDDDESSSSYTTNNSRGVLGRSGTPSDRSPKPGDRSPKGSTSPVDQTDLKQLEEYQDIEDSNNESMLSQLEGRDLAYGQIIQLFHTVSLQYLFAKNLDKSNQSEVGFRSDGNQKCYFKIIPRFHHLDGTKVFNDDLVLLRHEKSGLFLKEANFFNDQGVFAICLSDSAPTFWKISLSDLEGKSNQNLVKSNEPFRIFHREGGFVKVTNESQTTFTYDTKTPTSLNSIFEIELDTSPNQVNINHSLSFYKNNSQEVKVGQKFRIKLLGTDRYLSLAENSPDQDELKDISRLVVVPKEKKHLPNSTFTLSYVKEKQPVNNLGEDDEVAFGFFIRIQSSTKQWLHLMTDDTFYHNGDLVGTKKYYKNDDFQIKQIPKSLIEDYNFVSHRIQKIQYFLRDPNQKKILITDIKIILIEFIKFCTQSEIEDPLEREGTPIKIHQKILADPSHLPVILELLKRYFDFPSDHIVIVLIYRILKQICKSNIKIAIIINEKIQFISGPASMKEKLISYGLGSVLMEMYKNNNILLEALTPERVMEFIDTIKRTKDPKHMEILSEICGCLGKPVVKNQQYLCDLLLVKNSNLLMAISKSKPTVEIQLLDGTWLDISRFHSLDEKTQKYFEQTISLYGNISKGRNYNGIKLSQKMLDFKECVVCIKDEQLPYSLRGCFMNVLINVFMDCNPQIYTAQISYIWNPKIQNTRYVQELLESSNQSVNNNLSSHVNQNQSQPNSYVQTSLPISPIGSLNNTSLLNSFGSPPSSSPLQVSQSLSSSINTSNPNNNKNSKAGTDGIMLTPLVNTNSMNGANVNHYTATSTTNNTTSSIVISPLNLSPPITDSSILKFKQDDIFSTLRSEVGLNQPDAINNVLLTFLSNFNNLQLLSNTYQGSQRPKWLFFHKVLVAVYYAFKFGFFKRKEKIVLNKLVGILQMNNFEMDGKDTVDLGRTMGGSRILEDDSIIFINIKTEILKTLDLMLSLQKKNIFEIFLYDLANSIPVLALENTRMEEAKEFMNNKLSDTFKRDLPHDLSLCNTLLDLLKHENNQLSALSLSLLNRINKYRNIYAMLKGPLDKLFYLHHEHTNLYKDFHNKINEMTKICLRDLTDESTNTVLKYLASFIILCQDIDQEKRSINQKILRVMGIEKAIVGLLKIGCSLEDLYDHDDFNNFYKDVDLLKNHPNVAQTVFISKVFKSCYEFLKFYCQDNKENQKSLFNEIEFLIGHIIRYENVFGNVETLIQIFKSNLELSIKFGNSPYLKILVDFIFSQQDLRNMDPIFLKLLNVIMLPGTEGAVIENQALITNIIKEKKDKISKQLLVPFATVTSLLKDPKGSNLTKHTSSTSNIYKLHLTLEEVLKFSIQLYHDEINQRNSNSSSNNNTTSHSKTISIGQSTQNSTLKQPKLQKTAKQYLISNKSLEILPREFVLNLDLINLLNVCSHGKNTPTEVICREFLSMSECLDILVAMPDNIKDITQNLMIPEIKELFLENNVIFRFKSAYLAFLHEVYFNSDTLKGDLLALQSNENLWKLINLFSSQLNSLYESHAKGQMSGEYFTTMSRHIIMPMISILEKFYSQCFYFDKATQKHLQYSSILMSNLMKLYWVDQSMPNMISIPSSSSNLAANKKYKTKSTKVNDLSIFDNPSQGGLHPIIQDLRLDEKIQIYSYLSKCLKSMDRSALAPHASNNISNLNVNEVIKGCEEVMTRIDQNSRWGGRGRGETIGSPYEAMTTFTGRTSPVLMSKHSTNFYMTTFDSDDKYIRIVKKRGFDEVAKIILDVIDNKNIAKSAAAALQYDNQSIRTQSSHGSLNRVGDHSSLMSHPGNFTNYSHHSGSGSGSLMLTNLNGGALSGNNANRDPNIDNTTNFIEILIFQLRNSLYDNDEMKINCIRILSSLLTIPSTIEKKIEMQNLMSDLYCHSAAIGLLGSKNPEISFEALALFLRLIETKESMDVCMPNPKVKDDIFSYFTGTPDINFFHDIHSMIERAKINLRDTKRLFRMDNNNKTLFSAKFGLTGFNLNSSNDDNSYDPVNPYSKEFQLLKNVFRVLQLLCSGQSNIFKKNMVSQPENYKSYDILKEMCNFLKVLETIVDIDSDSIDLTIRFFCCMKEIVKNTPENQLTVTNVQVCKAISNILRKHHNNEDTKYLDLKIEVVDFLLFIVDKEDPRVVTKLIPELDYKVIESTTQIFSNQRYDNSEKSIKLASMSFRLIKILADHDKSQNIQLAECLQKCGEHCKSRIGRVELLHHDKLERIYFPIPSFSRRLIMEDKEQSKIKSDENILQENLEDYFLDNKISWNKTSEKIESFVDWSEYKLIELEHLHALKSNPLKYFLVSYSNIFKYASFLFSVVINLLLLIYSTSKPQTFGDDIGKLINLIRPISALQTLSTLLLAGSFFYRYGSVILYQSWVKYQKMHNNTHSLMFKTSSEKMKKLKASHKYTFIPLNIRFLVTDLSSVYTILAVIFSILGLALSPFFYSFHILQFSLKTKAMGIVIRAISRNKKTLLVMGIFILQAAYILSIFSYLFFSDKYVNGSSGDQYFCTTLFQCFLSNLFYGVPTQGQLVQFLNYYPYTPNSNSDTGNPVGWTIYNLIFYIIVSLILLNVILGIIVDTFGQIRDQRSDTESYKAEYCFICGIDRETFHKKGLDFFKHVEDDHNKWHYLYFFAYLKERMNNEKTHLLNDTELYVLEQISNRNYLKFFPIEMAMSLQVFEESSKLPQSPGDPTGTLSQSSEQINLLLNKSFEDMEKKITSNVTTQLNQTILILLEEIKTLRSQLDAK